MVSTDKSLVTLQAEIDNLNATAAAEFRAKPEYALEQAKRAEQLATSAQLGEAGYPSGIAASRIWQAHALNEQADFATSLALATSAEALALQLDDTWLLIRALRAAGSAQRHLSNFPEAQDNFQRAQLLAQGINDWEASASVALGLSGTFGEVGQYALAIQHAQSCLQLLREHEIENLHLLGGSYINLSYAHYRQGDYAETIQFGLSALNSDAGISPIVQLGARLAVAAAYRDTGEIVNALDQLERVQELCVESNNLLHLGVVALDTAETYFVAGWYVSAEQEVDKALRLLKEYDSPLQVSLCHKLLSKLAAQRGDHATALEQFQQYHALQNEYMGNQNMQQMTLLRASFEADVAKLEAEVYRLQTEELEKQVDERTHDLRKALERETVLGAELSKALQQSEAANAQRRQIIERVSHEFRTPMTVIQTSSDLLNDFRDQLSEDKRRTLHGRIKEAVAQIDLLLAETTYVSSFHTDATSVPIARTHVEFGSFCSRLVHNLRRILPNYGRVRASYDGIDAHRSIYIDEEQVQQIVVVLVNNALAFSGAEDAIELLLATTDEQLIITVKDEGIGISAEDMPHIFDLLYRGSNVGNRRGLGLGLYIARSLAESMGGTISAESSGKNGGTTMTLTLPSHQP